MPEVNHSHL